MHRRLFIAVPIPPEVGSEVRRVEHELRLANEGQRITWSDTNHEPHVTMLFLGSVAEEKLTELTHLLDRVRMLYAPFSFTLKALDAFPDQARPEVLTIALDPSDATPGKLVEHLRKDIAKLQIDPAELVWHPHLTLGRCRPATTVTGFETIAVAPMTWTIDRIELVESHLHGDRPHYEVLSTHLFQNK